jgi:hypothetical protein
MTDLERRRDRQTQLTEAMGATVGHKVVFHT